MSTLQKGLADLPVLAWRAYPRLWLVKAWVAMTVGDFVEGDKNLSAAEASITLLNEEDAHKLRPELAAFRASYASLVQSPEAIPLAQQALRDLPANYWMRGMLVIFLEAAYYSAGNLDNALEVLAQAPASSLPATDNQLHWIHLLAFRGTVS